MTTTLPEATASGLPKAHVWSLAEQFAQRESFMPGDRIEPLIARLGGTLTYGWDSIFEDGSLSVWGPGSFEIRVSPANGAERNRFTIAHELGHYVLHSHQGRQMIRAARIGTKSDRVEWEANWFASAFLMPAGDFRDSWAYYSGNLSLVATRYMVSPKAVEVRAQSLGLPF